MDLICKFYFFNFSFSVKVYRKNKLNSIEIPKSSGNQ